MWTEEQKATHRSGIGGSDIAAVMGISPWKTPYAVWLEKMGLGDGVVESPAMEWGTRLESNILDKFGKQHPKYEVIAPRETVRHPEHDFVLASVDGLLRKDGADIGVLEIKTASAYSKDAWGEENTADIPEYYTMQVNWYMGIYSLPLAIVAVLIGGSDYREYVIHFDAELFERQLAAGRAFWENHVLAQVAPPVSAGDGEALRQHHPEATAPPISSIPEIDALAERMEELKAQAAEIKAEDKLCRARIMEFLGEHEGVAGSWGSISWKKQRGKIAWKQAATEAGVTAAAAEVHRGKGSRVFRVNFKKKGV